MEVLKEIGIDWKDRRLIHNLFLGQKVKVRFSHGKTKSVEIGKGVRLGCSILPILFNQYREWLAKETLEGVKDFKMGGRVISTIKHSDNLVLLAKAGQTFQDMIDNLVEVGRKYGIEINVAKSKVMRLGCDEPLHIVLGNQELGNFDQFK